MLQRRRVGGDSTQGAADQFHRVSAGDLEVADRAYVIVRGRVTASGPAAALAADPELIARSYLGPS